MVVQSDGSLKFTGRGKKTFIFKKENYEEHCLKHSDLKLPAYLEDVLEKTLRDPDGITSGPQKNRETYYRVLGNIGIEYVHVLKIPVFNHKTVYYIASTYDFWAPSKYILHYLEKVIWKKTNSLLF